MRSGDAKRPAPWDERRWTRPCTRAGAPGADAGDDHEDLPYLWQDVYPSGGGAALAGLLPGMPGEIPAGGDGHEDLPGMRTALHI